MPRRPNILLMIADDHRHDVIGARGHPAVQTPVMDRLMAEGTAFTHAHCMGSLVGAVCVASRAGLMTGRTLFRSGMSDLTAHTTWPELLRGAGYRTHAVGKWHNDKASFNRAFSGGANIFFGGMGDQYAIPVRPYDPSGEYPQGQVTVGSRFSTEMFAEAACDFLDGYEGDDPFCLYVAFTSPHDPRTAPDPFAQRYDPGAMPLPENFLPEHPFDNGEMRVRDEMLEDFPRTEAAVRRHNADYCAMLTSQDHYMGQILEALERSGRAENTLVVYTSDHGLAVGQHGLMGKQSCYDHSLRIPMILRGPGVPRGERRDALVYLLDLYPTLCERAGVETPAEVEAVSLNDVLEGRAKAVREHLFGGYRDATRCVRTRDWKLIRTYTRPLDEHDRTGQRASGGTPGADRVQLFEIEKDPWEVNDRSGDPACAANLRAMGALLGQSQRDLDDKLQVLAPLPA